MTDFLEQVIRERQASVNDARRRVDDATMRANAMVSGSRLHHFHVALRSDPRHLAVIAEVKRVSPALGALAEDVDPAAQARQYVTAGASAISVLTEPNHWGGSLDDLRAIRAAVDVPILAKDVIVDPYQVYEARAAGADAVLLIAEAFPHRELRQVIDDAATTPSTAPPYVVMGRLGPEGVLRDRDPLAEMVALIERLGMTALVEAHEVVAFGRAVSCGSRVVGVNARNLRKPSEIDVGRVRQLHTFVHPDQILVAESGITSVDDARMLPARVDAVLIGTALMRADDPTPLIHGIASIKRAVHA
jgi:indole-3-glycerol phosphate synthase